ncbi:hypothetical protein RBU55_18400 [Pseudomonas chlororaphis subsp. aurantiaca]|uniref:hypothetical protein n=1 Tax=Pseudomonas chlororaphis TaxID=587753 RepID=UPI0027DCA157|nr:hypothetical protein [Pseudomonas chlororaphis]WMI97537.1 hypothetical protein RBU55_18400 [Pseudomonas chlororaphis subsp. aurantiaca]
MNLFIQPLKGHLYSESVEAALPQVSEVRLDLAGQLHLVINSVDILSIGAEGLIMGEGAWASRVRIEPLKKSKLKVVRYVFATWDLEEGDAGGLSDVYGLGYMISERCKGTLALQMKGEFDRSELHLEILK